MTETPVLNRTLQVGTQSEAIEVQAEAAVLETANSTLGTVVGSKTVTDLPPANRNFTQIIGLSAGASLSVNNATQFGKGTLDMSVNGSTPGQNNFQMDGVAVQSMAGNGSANAFTWGLPFLILMPFRNSRFKPPLMTPPTGATPAQT